MECRTNKSEQKSDEATVPGHEDDKHVIVGLTSIPDDDGDAESHDLSLTSSSSKIKINPDICRICHCEETTDERLISPCQCLGTMQYLHQSCLQRWIKSSGVKSCELCKFEFIMHSEIKPFKQWQKLDMNIVERRKIMCSVAFNVIAITCILWALLVLIDKTTEEIKNGRLQWPFWTKVIIVAIGFTGGLVFMYVQCKVYIKLCVRWRQFNQRIVIHSYGEQLENPMFTTGRKNLSPSKREDKGIITVLGASDLVPLNSNEASRRASNDEANNPPSDRVDQRSNRRHQSFLQRFFRFHRSNSSS